MLLCRSRFILATWRKKVGERGEGKGGYGFFNDSFGVLDVAS
jgi:hypothetical protein